MGKCVRITMNGPYTPGALVKCENCLDVYKSVQKNSCPLGTKLFSPQTRGDWKSFLASTTPLAAPNWIVDITRPKSGCGACNTEAMNSNSKGQNTWVTVDGSPWWLRADKWWAQPSGDYLPNCYLNLFPT